MADENFFIKECGFNETTTKEIIKNKKRAENLKEIFLEAKKLGDVVPQREVLNVLQSIKTKHTKEVIKYVMKNEISISTISLAGDYLKKLGDKDFNAKEFEKEIGLGVDISPNRIKSEVSIILGSKYAVEIKEKGWLFSPGSVLADLKKIPISNLQIQKMSKMKLKNSLVKFWDQNHLQRN